MRPMGNAAFGGYFNFSDTDFDKFIDEIGLSTNMTFYFKHIGHLYTCLDAIREYTVPDENQIILLEMTKKAWENQVEDMKGVLCNHDLLSTCDRTIKVLLKDGSKKFLRVR